MENSERIITTADGKQIPLREFKISIATKFIPLGILLGGVTGAALGDWEKKNWKLILGGVGIGAVASIIIISYRFNQIDESFN